MAEAEDVLTDAARHATVFAERLWRARRAARGGTPVEPAPQLADVAERLGLLVAAALDVAYPIRAAQAPAPPTLLQRVAARRSGPTHAGPLPATDGANLWLPPRWPGLDPQRALERWKVLSLVHAIRAARGSASWLPAEPGARAVYLVREALAADALLVARLPGLRQAVADLRAGSLAARPAPSAFPPSRRALEGWVRARMAQAPYAPDGVEAAERPPRVNRDDAARVAAVLGLSDPRVRFAPSGPLLLDAWTGELRSRDGVAGTARGGAPPPARDDAGQTPRTARLSRRPAVRKAAEDEDDDEPGAWMIQSAPPNEHVEDPYGLQRPTDRDERTAADDFADSLSELPEARLVATPGAPREILLSDDPPDTGIRSATPTAQVAEATRIDYPEWDCRIGAYRHPGATVRLLPCAAGSEEWVRRTLDEHRSMLDAIRRRFEMLRAQRIRATRQDEGDEVDLAAWVDARGESAAGHPMRQGLYLSTRRSSRDTAVLLLIDVSGSTDAWVGAHRRIIDVEREALLLVAIALEELGDPHAILAFSGEGPGSVIVRSVKAFEERPGPAVHARIGALEPEQYTRAGAALRHATALLMRRPARHRLLLLLSDGRPNDLDHYEGRYGVEDVRQAVAEAVLQGVFPFCLAIDRRAAQWLPQVFGVGRHARLDEPGALPRVLLEWLRRLLSA